MFKGAAWFSPSVPKHVRRQWVKHGGKQAGRGQDGIRRRLWYCFCNGFEDPKIDESRGLVAYHALWIVDSIKLQRALPMDGYILDPEYPIEALDVVLSSPKRRSRPLGPDSSVTSSIYSSGSMRKRYNPMYSTYSDSPTRDLDFSIDQDLELGDVFYTPDGSKHGTQEPDDSSSTSWDIPRSLKFEFEKDVDEDLDKSRVEELLEDIEMADSEEGNRIGWSEMEMESSQSTPRAGGALQLNANLVINELSELYPHIPTGVTTFRPLRQHENKMFSAIRARSVHPQKQ
ncbi:hypothetical protein RhiJN_01660 [Ceratobasidium sp. AG-Ba]|nr:hypothetical protein RhiJN_01660 [Ceratobasidium sp. AG-Ba]